MHHLDSTINVLFFLFYDIASCLLIYESPIYDHPSTHLLITLQSDKFQSKWQTSILPPKYFSRRTNFLVFLTKVTFLVQKSDIEIISIHFYNNNNNKFLYH